MKYKQLKYWLYAVFTGLLLSVVSSCKSKTEDAGDEDVAIENTQTPVTVTSISRDTMADYLDLSATSSYLLKSIVKANVNGYLRQVNVRPGQLVSRNQVLFTLETKEQRSIGNSINILDSSFHFSGSGKIRAAQSGFITQVDHQPGDYVQDGEQLGIIIDKNSFVFVMQLPYELRSSVHDNQQVTLNLPDGTKLPGHVALSLPTVDSASQTQGVVIRVNPDRTIPENLVARARFIKSAYADASSLPKSAVLSNEAQTEFFVMKLINDTTAVKIPVKKGIETTDRVQIVAPVFSPQDKILVTGNYSLPDTAKVKIIKP